MRAGSRRPSDNAGPLTRLPSPASRLQPVGPGSRLRSAALSRRGRGEATSWPHRASCCADLPGALRNVPKAIEGSLDEALDVASHARRTNSANCSCPPRVHLWPGSGTHDRRRRRCRVAAIFEAVLLRVTGLTNLGWMVTLAGPMRKGQVLRVTGCLGRAVGTFGPARGRPRSSDSSEDLVCQHTSQMR